MTDNDILAGLVKPLVWSDYETDEGTKGKRCSTGIGMCLCLPSGWFLVGQSGWKKAPNIEAAQAAAGADHAARVLASLHTDKLRALVEALTDGRDMLAGCTFQTMRINSQYIDRDETIANADAALAALQEPGP